MALGAFLKREAIVLVRRRTVFSERCTGLATSLVVILGCLIACGWLGYDRTSVAGSSSFSLAAFGLCVALQAMFLSGLVITSASASIASERDRKTLDALLATRVSPAEIVLGAIGSGLLRCANYLLPLIPLLTFMAVDPRLILLALAGIASTVLILAAASVAVSARMRTAALATQWMVTLAIASLWLPIVCLIFLPRAWPAAARWTAPLALPLIDASPVGVGFRLGGLLPRGTLVDSVLRMIAYQSAATVVLVLWSIARLRAASRAVHDAEGRTALRRLFRTRWRRRPACGDDPVLWHELYPRRHSTAMVAFGYALNVAWVGLVAYVVSWFAFPAFAELLERGYGAGVPSLPDIHPLARAFVGKVSRVSTGTAPGQARLEFNIILRQAAGVIGFIYALVVTGTAAESIVTEQERDTWPGLIATPLSGGDILRAKMIGAVLKVRILAYLLLVLWTVGLLVGSVHPLGYLASLAELAVASWFLAALGIYASLWGRDRNRATGMALGPLLVAMLLGVLPFSLPGLPGVLLATVSTPFRWWASLLSYEDVHEAFRMRVPPSLYPTGVLSIAGVWAVAGLWLVNLAAQGVGAFLLTRAAFRGFDRAVGRPVRADRVAGPAPIEAANSSGPKTANLATESN